MIEACRRSELTSDLGNESDLADVCLPPHHSEENASEEHSRGSIREKQVISNTMTATELLSATNTSDDNGSLNHLGDHSAPPRAPSIVWWCVFVALGASFLAASPTLGANFQRTFGIVHPVQGMGVRSAADLVPAVDHRLDSFSMEAHLEDLNDINPRALGIHGHLSDALSPPSHNTDAGGRDADTDTDTITTLDALNDRIPATKSYRALSDETSRNNAPPPPEHREVRREHPVLRPNERSHSKWSSDTTPNGPDFNRSNETMNCRTDSHGALPYGMANLSGVSPHAPSPHAAVLDSKASDGLLDKRRWTHAFDNDDRVSQPNNGFLGFLQKHKMPVLSAGLGAVGMAVGLPYVPGIADNLVVGAVGAALPYLESTKINLEKWLETNMDGGDSQNEKA